MCINCEIHPSHFSVNLPTIEKAGRLLFFKKFNILTVAADAGFLGALARLVAVIKAYRIRGFTIAPYTPSPHHLSNKARFLPTVPYGSQP